EVILRDAESTAKAPVVRRAPPRRAPANPLRRPPRRTIIQKVEPRIRAIPVRERVAAEVTAPGAALRAHAAAAPPAALPLPVEESSEQVATVELVTAAAREESAPRATPRLVRDPAPARPRPAPTREVIIEEDEGAAG